jgi:hypothetical protein
MKIETADVVVKDETRVDHGGRERSKGREGESRGGRRVGENSIGANVRGWHNDTDAIVGERDNDIDAIVGERHNDIDVVVIDDERGTAEEMGIGKNLNSNFGKCANV